MPELRRNGEYGPWPRYHDRPPRPMPDVQWVGRGVVRGRKTGSVALPKLFGACWKAARRASQMNIALWIVLIWLLAGVANVALFWVMACLDRSEERRVGKEGRSRWS